MLGLRKLALKPWGFLTRGVVSRQKFYIFQMPKQPFDPYKYDVLIKDFGEKQLHEKVSTLLGKTYLQKLQQHQAEYQKNRQGILCGSGYRGLISLPTRLYKPQPIWIHYLVDPVSPFNYLSTTALEALQGQKSADYFWGWINGRPVSVVRSGSNFSQVNILGMNYLKMTKSLFYDLKKQKMLLVDQPF